MPRKEKPAITEMKPSFRTCPQIARRDRTLEAAERRRLADFLHESSPTAPPPHRAADRNHASVRRFLSSITPSLRPRGLTTACHGRPIRSIAANLAIGLLIAIVIEHFRALGRQRLVELVRCPVGVGVAGFQVDQADAERRHRLRPDDAGIVADASMIAATSRDTPMP